MSDELDEIVPRIKNEDIGSLEKKYGIVLDHVEKIKKCNERLNWIVMLRPINKEVAGKLKSGAKGKIISIKGKSSEFKFLAGDVPYEAGLSKLGKNGQQSDLDRIDHFNSVNATSIKDSNDNEKVKRSEEQIIGKKQEIEERKQKIEKRKQKIEECKQQFEEFESKISKIRGFIEGDLSPELQQQLNSNQQQLTDAQEGFINAQQELETKQQELEIKQKELVAEQQTLEKYIQEFNLNFKLNTIQKTVEINGETYGCFYKVGENGRPEYEGYNKTQQPIVYIKDKENNYFKVKYDGSERGWDIDKNNPQQIDTKSIEELKIFSYEQYEKVGDDYKLKNPPLTADYDQLSAAEIYNKDDQKFTINDNIDSVVAYLKNEQEKLISFPANKYLRECKAAAKRLSNGGTDINDINLLSEISKEMDQIRKTIKQQYGTLTEENRIRIAQESDILQLKLGLLGVCGKSVTKNTMELGNILDYGISHGLEILHYPPEPIKLKHVDNELDEEFLVIDGEGNPRVARNLEGVLFFMNDQRNKGICCLEPNPLWPIKVNLNKSPHKIEVDADSSSPLLVNGFYTGVAELQKKLGTKSFTDEFIYAERLMLNSDFVPNIKLPDGVDIKDVRMEIETNNLIEAYEYYGAVLKNLGDLRENIRKNYNENFLEFCQEQRLSDLETNDVVLGIFRNEKIKEYFTNNVESLVKNLNKIEQLNIDEDIKDDVTKILMNDKIKGMLLSKPDNYDLKAKIFDILPNINLLKGFEIKKEVKGKESENFLECLDDYIKLVQDRQSQIEKRLGFDKTKIYSKIYERINKDKQLSKQITNINRRIKFLKEERRKFKDKRNLYDKKLEEIKTKRIKVVNTKNYWQQKISNERKNHKKSIKQL